MSVSTTFVRRGPHTPPVLLTGSPRWTSCALMPASSRSETSGSRRPRRVCRARGAG